MVLPSIRCSQNFLKSRRLVDALLDRSSIASGDVVLDIGAGTGLITERLAGCGCQVHAIEKDPYFAGMLDRRFGETPNVRVHAADFQEFPLPPGAYKVFASIPFSITTPIVARLTGPPNPPQDAYLVVQREAAARFTGEPQGTLWAALLAPWFERSIVHRFRRTDFDPIPQVDVVMLRLRKRGPPLVGSRDAQLYRDFVVSCFTSRRPRLGNTLDVLFGRPRGRAVVERIGLAADATPTRLRFDQWLVLFEAFKSTARSQARQQVAHAEQRLRRRQQRLLKVHRTRTPTRT